VQAIAIHGPMFLSMSRKGTTKKAVAFGLFVYPNFFLLKLGVFTKLFREKFEQICQKVGTNFLWRFNF
jgi:hypothetical protein